MTIDLYTYTANQVFEIGTRMRDGFEEVYLPLYFQTLHNKGLIDAGDLMKNNLVLHQDEYDIENNEGKGNQDSRFFCAKIDDEDLPWDTTEMDW